MTNHWPLIGRRPPSRCGKPLDTADPHAPITCPQCREWLQRKVAADRATAMQFKDGSQERGFHNTTADHYQAILDRGARKQVAA